MNIVALGWILMLIVLVVLGWGWCKRRQASQYHDLNAEFVKEYPVPDDWMAGESEDVVSTYQAPVLPDSASSHAQYGVPAAALSRALGPRSAESVVDEEVLASGASLPDTKLPPAESVERPQPDPAAVAQPTHPLRTGSGASTQPLVDVTELHSVSDPYGKTSGYIDISPNKEHGD